MQTQKPRLEIHSGLIVDPRTDPPTCCGYLFDFAGKGIFSPDGRVNFTKEQADTHNRLLAEGELSGLDKCEVGQRGTFYFSARNEAAKQFKNRVTTWTGVLVSDDVFLKGKSITFRRNGRVFRGILRKDADCFNFKRIQ